LSSDQRLHRQNFFSCFVSAAISNSAALKHRSHMRVLDECDDCGFGKDVTLDKEVKNQVFARL
jgi:hypothetical protein